MLFEDETEWKNSTFHLLSEPWKPHVDWKVARDTVDWWIQRSGGSRFAIQLMERTFQEFHRDEKNPASKELNEVFKTSRIRAMVERWSLDWSDEKDSCYTLDPTELTAILDSYRRIMHIDQSLFDIVHRTTMRQNLTLPLVDEPVTRENILPVLVHVERTGDPRICPSRDTIDHVLRKAFKETKEPIAFWAQNILDTMWSISRKYKWARIRPDFSIYQSVLRAWLNSDEPQKAKNMKHLIDEMEELAFSGERGLFPGKMHYTLLLSAYADTGDTHSAFELLYRLKSQYETKGLAIYEPTGKMYGVCMAALSRSDDPESLSRAEYVRKEAFQAFEMKGDRKLLPRSPFWTSYISVLARVGTEESLEKAEKVLDEMLTDRGKIQPNFHHYGPLIRGWAAIERPERAEALLKEMIRRHDSGYRDVRPDGKTYLDVTNAWARSGDPRAENRIRHLSGLMAQSHKASKSQSTEENRMQTKDDMGELLKMLSTAVNRDDASKAERMLYNAIEMYEEGTSETKISEQHYQAVITAWSKTKGTEALKRAESLLFAMLAKHDAGDKHVCPTEHGFTAVIAACARNGCSDCGERAQAVFDNMCRRFEAGNESLRPSVRSYSALIKAWSSAGTGKPKRAEHVLQQMYDDFLDGNISARPNVVSFNTVLAAWSRDTSEEALERATRILRLMQDLGESNLQLRPDIITFSSMIACCIRSSAPRRVELAESLLQEAKDRYSNGQLECRPNCMIYGALIQTIARSDVDGAADKAELYLREMLTLADFDPRQIRLSHHAVIGAWGRDHDRSRALERSEALVSNLIHLSKKNRSRKCLPDKFTYAQLLTVLSKTSPPDAAVRAEAVIKEMEALGVEADEAVHRIAERCFNRSQS